jgi:hypothetical protein
MIIEHDNIGKHISTSNRDTRYAHNFGVLYGSLMGLLKYGSLGLIEKQLIINTMLSVSDPSCPFDKAKIEELLLIANDNYTNE